MTNLQISTAAFQLEQEAAALARKNLYAREYEAEVFIREVEVNYRPVYSIHPEGGVYREGTRQELIDFLIANNYA